MRGPKWRTRTTPGRRGAAAVVTFLPVVGVGAAVLWAAMAGLGWAGAPTWVVLLPWLVPTVAALAWTSRAPAPAVPSDDDDDSWIVYAIRWVMVGPDHPRPLPARVAAAVVFGAPIGWSFVVFFALQLLGVL